MANMVYADPFGSYVKGQEAGTQNAVQTGIAARQFRAADLNPEVQKWYLPFKQREMAAETGGKELTQNEALQQYYAKLSALGPEAQQAFIRHVQQTTGVTPQLDQNSTNAFLQANLASGGIQPTYVDPRIGWGQPGGAFARPSEEGAAPPTDPLVQLQRELQIEQTKQQLESIKNRGKGGGMFDPAFAPYIPTSTNNTQPAPTQNGGIPPIPPITPSGGFETHGGSGMSPMVSGNPTANHYTGGGNTGGMTTSYGSGVVTGASTPQPDEHIYDPRPGSSGIFAGPVNVGGGGVSPRKAVMKNVMEAE